MSMNTCQVAPLRFPSTKPISSQVRTRTLVLLVRVTFDILVHDRSNYNIFDISTEPNGDQQFIFLIRVNPFFFFLQNSVLTVHRGQVVLSNLANLSGIRRDWTILTEVFSNVLQHFSVAKNLAWIILNHNSILFIQGNLMPTGSFITASVTGQDVGTVTYLFTRRSA